VDPSGDGGGALTAAGVSCGSCGTELPPNSKFCNECGAPLTHATRSAEYKQVTVLFADVVHSMDIAAAVGAERLREIMAELVNRAAVVVQRYDGTVGSFTGDGVMAVFGAPVALEDHAVRACMAALGVQDEAKRLAVEVRDRDGLEFQLRVGLNSGQVIAGEIGSGPFGYTAIGEQVGMAQRMESIAPPGGVMLSASTARLVEGAASLAEPELVQIKGADKPVAAQRLLGMEERHRLIERVESNLVGRRWEMFAVEGLLDRAIEGHGGVVGVVGPPGLGKSRLVREVSAMARPRGVEVFTAFCESHTSQVPFHAVTRLLRAAFGVDDLDGQEARDRVRDRIPEADPEDVLLFDDLLGITDPEAAPPRIDPDARRRRLTALVNAASVARETPAVYVVEDAHWIDEVSESMLADFVTVIPQTPSLALVTYRPDYEGALTRMHGTQTIALAPLSDPETAALVSELLGPDPSVVGLGQTLAQRAAGNPFFAEEIVRELAEREVLQGQRGAYISMGEVAEVSVPATLQATIAARIDRLPPEAKRTLSAAAVVGSRFNLYLLTQLGVEPVVADLVAAQFIDQVKFTRQPEFVFHHPLIRTVAYESQLKSDRAGVHRRLASVIEQRDHDAVGESAALIAEHLEAAGDLRSAYAWHMRAGAWSNNRDIRAARISWERARRVADALPANDPERTAMRIAPRTALCSSTWRAGLGVADTGFDELRELCCSAGDDLSLAIAMYGQVLGLGLEHRHREASALASEQFRLIEESPDALRAVGVMDGAVLAKLWAGKAVEAYRLAQWCIDLVGNDPVKGRTTGFGSPLAVSLLYRGLAGCSLGRQNWRDDMRTGIAMQRSVDTHGVTLPVLITVAYARGILTGALLADNDALRETADAVRIAEERGDDVALERAHLAQGLVLSRRPTVADRDVALEVLRRARDAQVRQRHLVYATMADIGIAELTAEAGEVQGAIESARSIVDRLFENGEMFLRGVATAALVETLLRGGSDSDLLEAEAAIERLAAVPTDPGFVLNEIPLLRMRALLAKAHGDEAAYRDYRDRYRAMAKSLGFEGHMKWAEAMP
jgi:class 3 adenylate cyclase